MTDLVFIVITVAFFALAGVYVRACASVIDVDELGHLDDAGLRAERKDVSP